MDSHHHAQSVEKEITMDKWLAIPEQTRRNAYIQIAEKTGMNAFAVEKGLVGCPNPEDHF
jgi:hypothetical protein